MQDAKTLFFAIFLILHFYKTGIDDVRFNFLVDWYDNESSLVRKFNLLYYTANDTIELIEVKNRRTFLKRIKCEGVTLKSIYIGSTINVFSRQMKIVDYGDIYTKEHFSSQTEKTFALLKPETVKYLGEIVDEIYYRGFKITKAKMCLLSAEQAREFYLEHEGKVFFLTLVQHISSAPVLAMELMGKDAVKGWRKEIGPTDVEIAKKEAPSSLRALFGINKTQNGFHGSDSLESAQRSLEKGERITDIDYQLGLAKSTIVTIRDNAENFLRSAKSGATISTLRFSYSRCNAIERMEKMQLMCQVIEEAYRQELGIFFPQKTSPGKVAPKATASFVKSTCCIIKPHAIEEGNLGKILKAIQNSSFEIHALRMFYLEQTDVEEFYEIYKGVVPEYNGMVGQLMSGPCVALEIKDGSSDSREEITSKFRTLIGPSDPDVAQELRPNSLRAKFGRTKVKNAIHCTDLPEDGLLEVEYFFKILE